MADLNGSSSTAAVLLIDPSVTVSSINVKRALGRPRKSPANPLFGEDNFAVPPRPWEQRFDNVYPTVIYDPDLKLYRCWYFSFLHDGPLQNLERVQRASVAYRSKDRVEGLLYAESVDGIAWKKPTVGLIEFDGSTDNNIVMSSGSHGIHAGGVLRDPHDPDQARRYKALFRSARDRRMAVAFSPDGLRWGPTVVWPEHDAVGDTHNNAVWDEPRQRFVAITRGWTDGPYRGERTVLRTESVDFVNWSEPVEIMRGTGLHDQIYSMPIARHGEGFIGLPAVFHKGDESADDWDTVDTELAWSSDGITWERICPGTPLIPRGAGSYPDSEIDAGCIYAAPPFVDGSGSIRLYYGGSNGLHNGWRESSLNLATLEADRFAGVEPESATQRASVCTRPVAASGDLTVNVRPGHAGMVRVAVLDLAGTPIPGFAFDDCAPITTDDVTAEVRWTANRLSDLSGAAVQLQFELADATLFAFSVSSAKGPSTPS